MVFGGAKLFFSQILKTLTKVRCNTDFIY